MADHDAPWTTRKLIRWMSGHFESHDVDAPRVVAEMLLAHVIGCDRMRLYMEADRPAAPEEREQLRDLVRRAAQHEPVQYLVGRGSFFGFELAVDDSTLIPQPCTEDLVTQVLAHLKERTDEAPPRVLDIGTGTGCIALAIARHRHDAVILATDVEPRALALAARNAEALGLSERVRFAEGAGLEPAHGAEPFDVICSNPPYIPDAEWNDAESVQRCVRDFVPERATRGGTDGMAVIRPLVRGAAAHLRPGGLLVVEIADSQRDAVLALARAEGGLEDASIAKDSEGYWRFLVARTASGVPAA